MAIEPTIERPIPAPRPLPPRPLPPRPFAPDAAALSVNATLLERIDLTDSVARFVVRPDSGRPHVEPGQYLSLGIVTDGRLLQRPYSTATIPGARDSLEFLIRRVPEGALTPRLWSLRAGDRLLIGPPKGLFTRIVGDSRAHLLVATGTGLAPFVAMTEAMRREQPRPRVVLVHGVSRVAELAYRDRFERRSGSGELEYVPTVSRPADHANDGWTGRTGRAESVLEAVWAAARLSVTDTIVYLCGNPSMIAAASTILVRSGMPADAIRSEHYWPG
jgi:ferredoxin-NADP reductase